MPSPAVPRARADRLRWAVAAALLGASAGALAFAVSEVLPNEGAVARGVRLGGVPVAPGETAQGAAEAAARRVLDRRITLTWDGETVVDASAAELGARVDVDTLARAASAVGRRGELPERVDDALQARRGLVDLPVRLDLPVESLAARLTHVKEERDAPPRAARLDFDNHGVTPHAPGRYVDVYAAAEAAARALAADAATSSVAVPVFEIAPARRPGRSPPSTPRRWCRGSRRGSATPVIRSGAPRTSAAPPGR